MSVLQLLMSLFITMVMIWHIYHHHSRGQFARQYHRLKYQKKTENLYGWYHFLAPDKMLAWGDDRLVKEGSPLTIPVDPTDPATWPKPRRRGLHASRTIVDAMKYAPGPILCYVSLKGAIRDDREDIAAAESRTVHWMRDIGEALPALRKWVAEVLPASADKIPTSVTTGLDVQRLAPILRIALDAHMAHRCVSYDDAAWLRYEVEWDLYYILEPPRREVWP